MNRSAHRSLAELLEAEAGQTEPARRASGQRFFVAQQDEIEKAIRAHWSLIQIWTTLHHAGRMPVGYRTFTGYVSRFITGNQKRQPPTDTPPVPPSVPPDEDHSGMPRGYGNKPKYQGYDGDEIDISDLLTPVDDFTP